MKSNDLLLLGGLALGAFLLWRLFAGKASGDGGGGIMGQEGFLYPDSIGPLSPGAAQLIGTHDTRGFTVGGVGVTGGGYIAPTSTKNAVIQALQSGATVYGVKKAGGSKRVDWVAVPQTGTRAAALTVGTPSQQIERYMTGPKIVAGKKVM